MAIYDSSASNPEDVLKAVDKKILSAAQPHETGEIPTVTKDPDVHAENVENMHAFADIAPATPSSAVEDIDRKLIERLREQDPEQYQRLLSTPQENEKPVPEKPERKEGFLARLAANLKFKSESEVEEWMQILERPLSRPIVCGFTSFKGGCGKTSLSMITASVMKQCRPDDKIIVIDVDPSGNLANRAMSSQSADIQGYAAAIKMGQHDPAPYVLRGGDGVDIIGSRINPLDKELNAEQVVAVIETLTYFYDVIVLDMPQRMDTNAYKAMLLMLDVVTFVFEAKNDALPSVEFIKDVLVRNDASYLDSRRVVAFNHTSIVNAKASQFTPQETVHTLIHKDNVEVVELPYADSLREAGVLERDTVPRREYNKFVQLAAAVINSVEDKRTAPKPSVYAQ